MPQPLAVFGIVADQHPGATDNNLVALAPLGHDWMRVIDRLVAAIVLPQQLARLGIESIESRVQVVVLDKQQLVLVEHR